VQTGDIANARGYINSFTQTYSEEGLAQSKLWPNGTLCITIAANIAKTAILTFDACFPDSVVGLLPGPALTTEYVRYWFVAMEKAIDASATQVAQKNINLELLRSLDIQLPSMSLQKRFSDLAGRVQQFKSKHHSLSLTQSELFNSLIHQAFQGQL
jgi:type I restriction enzyme S subunit